jgi:CheY-like chemotaxis protein
MEAIGQLAGGVAHDFNNLLQVIQGYSEAIQMSKEEGTREWQEIAEVLSASERASQLTRQLLAFSRRQVIEPVVTDLNILIKDVLRMLRRVIGEHIEISFLPCTGLGTIFVDKGQMEQVMMNLCVNARDAMARGGRITIVTENVVLDGEFCTLNSWAIPGQFARVSVADTGHGMDAEICARIFEPFFTTKELGRGTGLGLATVYGIVRQHNGLINVESEVGKGTRFGVYIPIHQNSVTVAAATELPPAPGGKETILISEDEPSVMNLLAMILRNAGYNVLMSANGGEAVEVFDKNADTIDLVLLDVMMPVLSGKEAMDVIKARQKDVAFLFSSGYSESAIHKDFVIQEGLTLIQKPYRRNDILREVRRILDDRAANRKSRD